MEGKRTTQGVEVSLDGSNLVIVGKQVPAGNYDTTMIIRGSNDSRYYAEFTVPYTVYPVPGGEHGLLLSPSFITESVEQGARKTVTFKATPPTWSDAPLQLQIVDSPLIENLQSLGGDLYSFDINAVSQREGEIRGGIVIRSRAMPEVYSLSILGNVAPAVVLSDEAPSMNLGLHTVPGDFLRSIEVLRPDGSKVPWTATVDKPWVKLTRSQGVTGQDSLGLQFDQTLMGDPGWSEVATLTVKSNMPGTLARKFTVYGSNTLPVFDQASVSAVFSGRSKFYVSGYLLPEASSIDRLRVDGARLVSAKHATNPRIPGSLGDLWLEVDEAMVGRPVTLSFTNPLAKTTISLPVVDRPRVSMAFAALPRADYRPVSFGRLSQSAYFAGGGAVWRWEHRDGTWQVPQSRSVPNLIDAAIAPTETAVYALRGRDVIALSPTTLSVEAQATLTDSQIWFDPTVPTLANALVFADDGRAQAVHGANGDLKSHGVDWLRGIEGPRVQASQWSNLVKSPFIWTPGQSWWSYPEGVGPSLVRSASGTTVMVTGTTGTISSILGWGELPVGSSYQVPPQTPVISVSDDGQLAVQSDGQIRMAAFGWTSTSQLLRDVPLGYEVGGYGLSGDGRVALVYGYRKVQDQGQLKATDAKAWMIDLRQIPTGAGTFKVLSEIPLPSPVGCITKLDVDESCSHRAHVQFLVGDRNALILGPRGILAFPLPEVPAVGMTSTRVPAPKAKRSLAPIQWPASR